MPGPDLDYKGHPYYSLEAGLRLIEELRRERALRDEQFGLLRACSAIGIYLTSKLGRPLKRLNEIPSEEELVGLIPKYSWLTIRSVLARELKHLDT
jgi:hypothetical protein